MHYRSCGKINHCNIVKFHGYSIDFEASQIHFYLISEYCNSGDLSNFLKKEYADWGLEDKTSRSDKIDTCLFMSIAAQVASACSHLISQKIVHRDLAVRNVMVNMSGMSMNTSVSDINLHESRTRTIFNKNYRKIGELHSRMNFLQMFHVKLSDFGLAREMNYPRQTENNKGPDRFSRNRPGPWSPECFSISDLHPRLRSPGISPCRLNTDSKGFPHHHIGLRQTFSTGRSNSWRG